MDLKELQSILTIGETVAVEFKRCGNGIENDTYETVCSFLNRFGGDLFMGVLDDGSVLGVPEKAASDMVKNFIKVISNPVLFRQQSIWCRKSLNMMKSEPSFMFTFHPVQKCTVTGKLFMTGWMMRM